MTSRHSIIFKVTWAMIILTVLANFVIHHFVDNRIENLVEKRMEEEGSLILQSLDWALSPMLEKKDDNTIQRLIDNIGAYEIVENLRVYNKDCVIQYSNKKSEIGMFNENNCVASIVEEKRLKAVEINMDEGHFGIAVPIRGDNYNQDKGTDVIAVLFVGMNTEHGNRLGQAIKNDFQWIYILTNLVFTFILLLIIYQLMGRPLKHFRNATQKIADHHYDHRLDLSGKDEFSDLANAFNKMAENIEFNTTELEKAKSAAESAGEAKMNFLANMSHEIRTPLNTVIGFAEILEEGEENIDKRKQLSIIHNAGNHLLSVISDILDVSKIESEHVQLEKLSFSIRNEIEDIKNMFHLNVEKKNLDFIVEVTKDVPDYLLGDVFRVRQIIINLVNNAIKFTVVGQISIKVNYKDSYLNVLIKDTGIGVEPDKLEYIFNAFEQSDDSTTRMYGGTGLGLAISRRLARMMGGDITIYSDLGMGSEFKVSIKLDKVKRNQNSVIMNGEDMVLRWISYDSDVVDLLLKVIQGLPKRISIIKAANLKNDIDKLEMESHSLKGVSGNYGMEELYLNAKELNEEVLKKTSMNRLLIDEIVTRLDQLILKIPEKYFNELSLEFAGKSDLPDANYKILVAEDVEENRLLIEKMLEVLNVKIDFAVNGLDALEKLHSEMYDLLLLDIQMPLLDGSEVIKWIRENELLKKLYVIVITANATKADMEKYLTLGCDAFLSKPIKKQILRKKIRELMILKNSRMRDENGNT